MIRERVATVTGAARGIGRGIALALAEECQAVIAVDVLAEPLAETTAMIRERGADAVDVLADVRDIDAVRSCVEATADRFGRLDILINNAGYGVVKPSLEQTEEDWDGVIDSCLKATFFFSQAAARVMIPARRGVILNISSICGLGGWPRRVPYSAAKAGIVRITQGLGAEWALHDVRVVGIAPGHILTKRLLEIEAEGTIDLSNMRRRTPPGRLGQVDDIVHAVRFLVSDDARHITGVVLPVDGGYASYDAPEAIQFELRETSDAHEGSGTS